MEMICNCTTLYEFAQWLRPAGYKLALDIDEFIHDLLCTVLVVSRILWTQYAVVSAFTTKTGTNVQTSE